MRIAIVDDEPEMAADIQKNIQTYCSKRRISVNMQIFSDGEELLKDYTGLYDVIFLDIEMKNLDGMEAARRIRKTDQDTILVFITRMAQFAVEGYRVDALDFLVKPVSQFQFEMVFGKVLRHLKMRSDKKILLNVKGTQEVIPVKKLLYVEVQGHYLTWHTEQKDVTLKGTLGEAQELLAGQPFLLCSRYCLVNLRFVSEVRQDSLILKNGTSLGVSRAKRKEVLKAMANYIAGRGF